MNLISGKIYIGKTNNKNKRWRDHILISKNSNHKDYSVIHKALNKYGLNNFQITIIQKFTTNESANKSEKYWIEYYKTYIEKYGNEFGYNLTAGGDGMQAGTLSGIKNPKAKLSEQQVKDIKLSNLPTKQLSSTYNVHRTIIQRIRRDNIWNTIKVDNKPLKNTISKVYKDLHAMRGEGGPNSKLTWKIVNQLRLDFSTGKYTISYLARKYSISWSNIKFILQNKTWII